MIILDLELVGNNSLAENVLKDLVDTYQIVLNTTQDIASNLTNIKEIIETGKGAVQGAIIELNRDISNVSSLVSGIANQTAEETIVLDNMLQGLILQSETLVEQIDLIRLDIDANLRQARRYLATLDDIRLGITNRRLRVEQEFRLKEVFENAGLVTYTSVLEPPQEPTGEVSNTAGLLTDLSEFFSVTITYSTETLDVGNSPPNEWITQIDPDLGVPLDTLTGDAGNTWQTQVKVLLSGPPTVFVHQRKFSLFCDNNFLLENRNQFYSIQDIMEFMGPPGCTPGASLEDQIENGTIQCNCWARIQRSRCSAVGSGMIGNPGTPFSQTTPLISLKGSSGVCRDSTESDLWFQPLAEVGVLPDESITQTPEAEIFLDIGPYNEELQKICGLELHSSASSFFLFSSATGYDINNLGGVIEIESTHERPLCSIHHAEMEFETIVNSGPGDEFLTVPYYHYRVAQVATTSIFRLVATTWEVEKYGGGHMNVFTETLPFHVRGTQREPFAFDGSTIEDADFDNTEPPPLVQRCEIITMAATSPDMIPVYTLVRRVRQQQVTITFTNEGGSFSQERFVSPTIPPDASVPPAFTFAGYLDCLYLDCGHNFLSLDFGTEWPHLYDFALREMNPQGEPQLREDGVNAIMDFAPPTIDDPENPGTPIAPFAPEENPATPGFTYNPINNPRPISRFTVDDWLKQEQRVRFDPTRSGADSAHRHLIFLQEKANGMGPECVPFMVRQSGRGRGVWCSLLDSNHIIVPGNPSFAPALDAAQEIVFTPDEWSAEFTFVISGVDLTTTVAPRLECPNPQQIHIIPVNRATANIEVENEHSYNITIIIESVALGDVFSDQPIGEQDPGFEETNITETCKTQYEIVLRPNDIIQRPMRYCDAQRVRVQVKVPNPSPPPTFIIQDCYETTYNLTDVFATRDLQPYHGDQELSNLDPNNTMMQFTQLETLVIGNEDSLILSLAVIQGQVAESLLNARIAVLNARQVRNQTAGLPSEANRNLLLEIQNALMFANQELQSQITTALALQLEALDEISNLTSTLEMGLHNITRRIKEANDAFNDFKVFVDNEINGNETSLLLTDDDIAHYNESIVIFTELSAVASGLSSAASTPFPPLDGPEQAILDQFGLEGNYGEDYWDAIETMQAGIMTEMFEGIANAPYDDIVEQGLDVLIDIGQGIADLGTCMVNSAKDIVTNTISNPKNLVMTGIAGAKFGPLGAVGAATLLGGKDTCICRKTVPEACNTGNEWMQALITILMIIGLVWVGFQLFICFSKSTGAAANISTLDRNVKASSTSKEGRRLLSRGGRKHKVWDNSYHPLELSDSESDSLNDSDSD